jgi:hypothetical protein
LGGGRSEEEARMAQGPKAKQLMVLRQQKTGGGRPGLKLVNKQTELKEMVAKHERGDEKGVLVLYDKMCQSIKEAHDFDELKDISNEAELRAQASRIAKDKVNERRLQDIKVRAERRLGQLLAEGKEARQKRGRPKKGPRDTISKPTLLELGVSKKKSQRMQKLGAVSQGDFEKAIREAEKPTLKGLVRATEPPKPEPSPASKRSVKLWNTLYMLEREYVGLDPDVVLSSMEADVLDDVHRMAPRVAAWLKRIGELS